MLDGPIILVILPVGSAEIAFVVRFRTFVLAAVAYLAYALLVEVLLRVHFIIIAYPESLNGYPVSLLMV